MMARVTGVLLGGLCAAVVPMAPVRSEPAAVSVRIGAETLSAPLPDGSGAPVERMTRPNAVTVAVPGTDRLPPGTLRLEAWPFQPGQTLIQLVAQLSGFTVGRCTASGSSQRLIVPSQPGPDIDFLETTCSENDGRVTRRGMAKLVTGAGGVFMATRLFDRPAADAPAAGTPDDWADMRPTLRDAALRTFAAMRLQRVDAALPEVGAELAAAGLLTVNGATLTVAVPAGYVEAPPEETTVTFRPGPEATGTQPGTLVLAVTRTDPFVTRPRWNDLRLKMRLCGDTSGGGDVERPGVPAPTAASRMTSLMCTHTRNGRTESTYVLFNVMRRDDALFWAGMMWRFPDKEVNWLPEDLHRQALAMLDTMRVCRVGEPGCAPLPLPAAPASAAMLQTVQFRGERLRVAVPPRYVPYPAPSLDQEQTSLTAGWLHRTDDTPSIALRAVAPGDAAFWAEKMLRQDRLDCGAQVPGTRDDAAHLVDCSPDGVGGIRVVRGTEASFVVVVTWRSRASGQLTDAMRAQASHILQSAETCGVGEDCQW